MDESAIIQFITTTFPGVERVVDQASSFFFYGSERQMPFATLVTNDKYDQHSDLDRPDVFRLNIGVSKGTFEKMIGTLPANFGEETKFDFTATDKFLPHPDYGKMNWICVLNPGDSTLTALCPLLAEAYELDVQRHNNKRRT